MAIKPKQKKGGDKVQAPRVHKSTRDKNDDPNALPITYKFAAETLETMNRRGGSAGSIVVNRFRSYNYKLIFALAMNTLKHIKIIRKVIYDLKLGSSMPEDNQFLLEILVGDLLYGKELKAVEGNPMAAAILGRKNDIIKQEKLLKKEFSSDGATTEAKYLRINHLRSNMEHITSQLKTVGLTQLEYDKDKIKFKKFINKFKSMEPTMFMVDFHFPNDLILLKSAAADKLKKTDLIRKGKVVLQDKASFLAVEALDPQPNQKIIDACFAPGGKTSAIASKMKNKGRILAYDLDKKRLVQALHLLKQFGVTCAKAEVQDFSKVKIRRLLKTLDIEHFDSILIDPSCSGSGIQSRIDYRKTDHEAGRLKKLQAFQVALLKHAITSKATKTIVYCTCSSSVEENEEVIKMSLEESGESSNWSVVEVLPYWPHRGDSSYEFGSKCLRSDSNNLTNGFFIAKLQCNELFVRTAENTNGESVNKPIDNKSKKVQLKGKQKSDQKDNDEVENADTSEKSAPEDEENDEDEEIDNDEEMDEVEESDEDEEEEDDVEEEDDDDFEDEEEDD